MLLGGRYELPVDNRAAWDGAARERSSEYQKLPAGTSLAGG